MTDPNEPKVLVQMGRDVPVMMQHETDPATGRCFCMEGSHPDDPDMQEVRADLPGPELVPGLRGPTLDEAEQLVMRAERIAASGGLTLKQALAALRDVTGWHRKES